MAGTIDPKFVIGEAAAPHGINNRHQGSRIRWCNERGFDTVSG